MVCFLKTDPFIRECLIAKRSNYLQTLSLRRPLKANQAKPWIYIFLGTCKAFKKKKWFQRFLLTFRLIVFCWIANLRFLSYDQSFFSYVTQKFSPLIKGKDWVFGLYVKKRVDHRINLLFQLLNIFHFTLHKLYSKALR